MTRRRQTRLAVIEAMLRVMLAEGRDLSEAEVDRLAPLVGVSDRTFRQALASARGRATSADSSTTGRSREA